MREFEPAMNVGEHFITEFGTEFVVSGKWEHEKWTDYALINIETGREGVKRIKKVKPEKPKQTKRLYKDKKSGKIKEKTWKT